MTALRLVHDAGVRFLVQSWVWVLVSPVALFACGGSGGPANAVRPAVSARTPGTTSPAVVPRQVPPSPTVGVCDEEMDAGGVFLAEQVEGTFVLRNGASGCTRTTNQQLSRVAFRPQSTFKIANTLIGLDSGVIAGREQVWQWDGKLQPLVQWQQDLDLAGALRVSCVPCFQDVARRVGAARMGEYLDKFGYGNADVGGAIDQFWLTGPLRITPRGQTEFVHRSLSGQLPVSEAHVKLLWSMLEIERGPGFAYYGKTGLGAQDGRAIGWLVGYVERAGHYWSYATFVRTRAGEDARPSRLIPIRGAITRKLLENAGLLSPALNR